MGFSTSISANAGGTHGLCRAIGAAVKRAWFAYMDRRLQKLISVDLHGMSDRELKDIGLSRPEINAALRGPGPLAPEYLHGRHY